ncbi:type III secretion system inner membrane ring lipoprotein SctJ [Thalassococcus sp. S3]|uniref:type III secretion system inner membrane ring lipoprotein SctJ n=1 Tax=Thalassococcus sp. S3 TaxID=2017482 RepID=UPI0010248A26|nr:type III secretion inner membrane ring lipoprotein SctJ [Thalassococcus sp. S3]QBF33411.1 EscJ/YscJ/HrcJ family type III secretion inner membrane ring protein [Thalassococcus sp. S3]
MPGPDACARFRRLAMVGCLAALSACQTDLYTNLTERDANQIVAVLASSGISASRVVTSPSEVTVQVHQDDFARAIEVLDNRGLPRKSYATLSDVFAGDGFVVSPVEERARLVFAISEELSHTLSEIDGVLSARVHAVLPSEEVIGKPREAASASVFLRHVEGTDLRDMVPEIKILVANSIEGLHYDNVSVFLVQGMAEPVTKPQPPGPAAKKTPASLWAFAATLITVLFIGATLLLRVRRKADDGRSTGNALPAQAHFGVIAEARKTQEGVSG